MNIAAKKVVVLEYQVKDGEGQLIDSSEDDGPLAYIHGTGNLIPGLEKALEGRVVGDSLRVTVSPEEGYGERDEDAVEVVSREQFEEDDIEVGMQFETMDDGEYHIVTVIGVEDDDITLDANHPLAGITLHFEVEVVEVREATAEELEHGHVHGPGGHQH